MARILNDILFVIILFIYLFYLLFYLLFNLIYLLFISINCGYRLYFDDRWLVKYALHKKMS